MDSFHNFLNYSIKFTFSVHLQQSSEGALAEQGQPPQPPFQQGVQVAVFHFWPIVGCRSTTSVENSRLPQSVTPHKGGNGVQQEPNNLCLGLIIPLKKDSLSNGGLIVMCVCQPPTRTELSGTIGQLCGKEGACSGHDSSHYCPFFGGGNVDISRVNSATSAIVVKMGPINVHLRRRIQNLSRA